MTYVTIVYPISYKIYSKSPRFLYRYNMYSGMYVCIKARTFIRSLLRKYQHGHCCFS